MEADMDWLATMYDVEYGNVNLALVLGEFSTVKNDLVTEMTQMLGLPNTKKVIKKWNPSVSMTVKRCQIL